MIKNAYGWSFDRAMKSSIDTTLAAKEAGLYTVFFTIDATRTELNRFLDIVSQVATEGPHGCADDRRHDRRRARRKPSRYVVPKVIERLKKPVEIHCHQDFGLGVANTLAALQAGASVAHTTITGLGERAGNVPMEDVVLSLLCLHDINLGIKTEKFVETSKFVMDLAKVTAAAQPSDRRRQAVRSRVGHHRRLGPPVPQGAPARVVPFAPELVGQKPVNIVLGKNSGPPSMEEWAEKTGIKVTDEERMALLLAVKAKSFEKKDLLTAEEFKEIVARVLTSYTRSSRASSPAGSAIAARSSRSNTSRSRRTSLARSRSTSCSARTADHRRSKSGRRRPASRSRTTSAWRCCWP